MKFYFLYIVTSLLTAWVIIVLLSVSAGFANLAPIAALIGALLLFAIATPILLYRSRIGLILGLIFLTAMLPFTIDFAKSVLGDGVFNWGVIFSFLPALITVFALYLSVRQVLFQQEASLSLPANSLARFVLAAIPVGITFLYFVLYGKEWF
jgi:hypothetical protein